MSDNNKNGEPLLYIVSNMEDQTPALTTAKEKETLDTLANLDLENMETVEEATELSEIIQGTSGVSWDPRILLLTFKRKPRTEISRTVGRSTSYIKKIEQLPEFQRELAELKGIITGEFVDKTLESLNSAREMRAEALKALHTELLDNDSSPQGRIASAKVLLDEAHREDLQNRGERERPLSLNEVRRMTVEEAKDLAKEFQIKRSK